MLSSAYENYNLNVDTIPSSNRHLNGGKPGIASCRAEILTKSYPVYTNFTDDF
jgi:hypothetical protein